MHFPCTVSRPGWCQLDLALVHEKIIKPQWMLIDVHAVNHISIASATRPGTAKFNYERDFQLCKTCPDDAVPCEDWPSQTTRE